MTPEDRRRLKQHIEMIVEHKMPEQTEIEKILRDAIEEQINGRLELEDKNRKLRLELSTLRFKEAQENRFCWWIYSVYSRNVCDLIHAIMSATTYDTEGEAKDGRYSLPKHCFDLIKRIDEYTEHIYDGTLLDIEMSTEPSNSDVSMIENVLTDVKTWQSFEELKPDIAKRYEELLNIRNMETEQFNDGFNDARAGKLETDHPHYDFDTDNWRLGYAWGMFEPMKEKLARERQVSDALYLLLVDDPNTKLKAEQILIDIYGKCEPSPSDVSVTQDVSIDIKTPSSIENTNPSILRKTDGLGNCILQETK